MSILKILFIFVLTMLLAIIAFLYLIFGNFFTQDGYIQESKIFVDNFSEQFFYNPDVQLLKKHSHPNVFKKYSENDYDNVCKDIKILGKPVEYLGSEGKAEVTITINKGRVVTAEYLSFAKYKKQKIRLSFELQKIQDEFKITYFSVGKELSDNT